MASYDDTTDVEVTVPTSLLAAVDETAKECGHDSRSEAVQAALLTWVGVDDAHGTDDGGTLSELSNQLGVDDVNVDVGVDVGVDE